MITIYTADLVIKRYISKCPDPQIPGFEWSQDDPEISGFGGVYERRCRQMVSQGCRWWTENPAATPLFKYPEGIFGVEAEKNDDARALSTAMNTGLEGWSTVAMRHAAVQHVMHWRQVGSWAAHMMQFRTLRTADDVEV